MISRLISSAHRFGHLPNDKQYFRPTVQLNAASCLRNVYKWGTFITRRSLHLGIQSISVMWKAGRKGEHFESNGGTESHARGKHRNTTLSSLRIPPFYEICETSSNPLSCDDVTIHSTVGHRPQCSYLTQWFCFIYILSAVNFSQPLAIWNNKLGSMNWLVTRRTGKPILSFEDKCNVHVSITGSLLLLYGHNHSYFIWSTFSLTWEHNSGI
jgi:hypothetical protein